MNRSLIPALLLLASLNTQAQSSSNDFSNSESSSSRLNAADLRRLFELKGEVFVANGQGDLLYQAQESRLWKFGRKEKSTLFSNWSFKAKEIPEIALQHEWDLSESGRISVQIKQFDSMSRIPGKGKSEIKTGKLLREEKIDLKDFAPINWVASSAPNRRVIVRLTPTLSTDESAEKFDSLPLSVSSGIVYDNKGRVWAQSIPSLSGKYISIKTHLGLVALSLYPFKGAKELGTVKASEIMVNGENDLRLFIRSTEPILAGNQLVKIYGLVNPNKKEDTPNSVSTSSSSTESRFLENFR